MKEKRGMNEDTLRAIINAPFAGVEATSSTRDRAANALSQTKPQRRSRLGFRLAVATGIAVLGTITLWPRPSAAAALIRLRDAISNVHSMRATAYVNFRSDPAKPVQELLYENGSWLGHFDLQRKPHWSLAANNRIYQWDEDSTVATIEPSAGPIWMRTGSTALDFVKNEFGFDLMDCTSTMKPHADVDGHATYVLFLERKLQPGWPATMKGSCEVVVDKESDLPIMATIRSGRNQGGEYVSTINYSFDVSFPPNTFEPCNGDATQIRDLPQERKDLLKAWATPLGVAKQGAYICAVRDIVVNPSGTIFMEYTGNPGNPWMTTPTFAPSDLRTDDGTVYLRARDFGPGALLSTEDDIVAEMTMDGRKPAVCVWVPLEPIDTNDDLSVHPEFRMRTYTYKNVPPNYTSAPVTLDVIAKHIDTEYPDWSVPLHLDYIEKQLPEDIDALRADYYKDRGAYNDAARWYLQSYDDEIKVISTIAYRRLGPAVECLEKAGDEEGALKLKKIMLRDKAADPNLSDSERDAAKKELDALN